MVCIKKLVMNFYRLHKVSLFPRELMVGFEVVFFLTYVKKKERICAERASSYLFLHSA